MDLLPKIAARFLRPLALAALIPLVALSASAQTSKVKVSGFGLFGNAELRNALQLLEFEETALDARKIDDGAFLLLTRLRQNGYLDAALSATYPLPDGGEATARWSGEFEAQISQEVETDFIHYRIEPGLLYYYDSIEIEGLSSIDTDEAKTYFLPDVALYLKKGDKAYSPSNFSGQQKQLISALAALGRTDARIVDQEVELNTDTGSVAARLRVEEGPLYQVRKTEVAYRRNGEPHETVESEADAIYSRFWVEDQIRKLRNESYRNGFPDTTVTSRIAKSEPEGGNVFVTVRFEVAQGPKIVLSEVEHRGASDTNPSFLARKTDLKTGESLDITEVEAARRRLSRLGIFKRIDLSYEQDGPGARKAIFDYTNGERTEWQLLLGYGSYESVRGGVIGRRNNLLGRAHSLSFQAVRSVKSTSAKINYSVPELFGETISGRFEALFLDREELFFDRTERGVSVGLSKSFRELNTDVGIEYAFERKRSSDPQFNADFRLQDTNIGSISLRANHSTLDNLLYPTGGYELFTSLRYAAKALGGQTEFTRPEFGAAYHRKLGSRWIFHAAAKGGMVVSPGDNATEIPFGERFVIGGENTLRGFRRGEAGPIDDSGIPIGAEAFALINLELEYPLFNQLNAVVFLDSARVWNTTGRLDEYEDFYNVGIGLRYNTIIGPVRLEYGHNLTDREGDPDGTLHLSIGFPF